MTASRYKVTTMYDASSTATPSREAVSALRLLRWQAWRNLLAAQDTIAKATRRVLASHSLQGAQTYPVPGDVGDPSSTASRLYPDRAYRPVAEYTVRLTPGAVLEVRGWYVPAGQTQRAEGGNFVDDGAGGRVRVSATWRAGGNTSGPTSYTRTLDASPLQRGAVPVPAASHIREILPIALVAPAGLTTDTLTAALFSEGVEVDLVLEVSGGARVGDLVVVERGYLHVDDVQDADTGSTVHGYQVGAGAPVVPQTTGPQTEASGANEPRFGTSRSMSVAERQSQRCGPALSWSAWQSSASSSLSTAAQSVDITSTSYVDIFEASSTSWSASSAGMLLDGGAYAADWGLSSPTYAMTGRSQVPVRVEVLASCSGGGFQFGRVRLQSGPLSVVDVEVPHGSPATVVAYGWLETQREGDGSGGVLQVFGSVDNASDTLQIQAISVTYGHW